MKIVNLFNVKVEKKFLLSNVSDKKIENAKRYFEKHKKFDKPVILNNGVLIDNYARFIAAYLMGLHDIPCIELQEMTYIVGKFYGCDKEYTWKNDKGIDIKVGDIVQVECKPNKDSGIKKYCVVVTDIIYDNSLEMYNKHRSVTRKMGK